MAYLITRAYFALRAPALHYAEERGISWADRYLLGALLDANGLSLHEINDMIGYTGLRATPESAQRLRDEGYLTVTTPSPDGAPVLWLSKFGREYCLSMIARTRASEAEAEMQLGREGAVLRCLLKRLIDGANAPDDGRMGRHMDMIGRNIESFGRSEKGPAGGCGARSGSGRRAAASDHGWSYRTLEYLVSVRNHAFDDAKGRSATRTPWDSLRTTCAPKRNDRNIPAA